MTEFAATTVDLVIDIWPSTTHLVLLYQIHIAGRSEIQLATDDNFARMDGFLSVTRGLGQTAPSGHIGQIAFVPAYTTEFFGSRAACYHIDAVLTPPIFDQMLTLAQRGALPTFIFAEFEGMAMDLLPDGSSRTWQNDAHPQLPLVKLTFRYPLTNESAAKRGGEP